MGESGGVLAYPGRVRNALFEPASRAGLAVTRLGGQPSWLVGPAWPLAAKMGSPTSPPTLTANPT